MTTHKEFYYILTFTTTTDAMCADKCAKENTNDILEAILKFCKTSPFNGKLFKMHTKRINGHHPIDPVSLTSFDFSE